MARSSIRARPGPDVDQDGRDPGWRERRVRRLERDVAVVERTGGWIDRAVWGIALGVMVYGAVNVTPLLIEHGVLRWTAPGLPLMVDLAMCIGLWGDRIMHQYGRTAGWVTVAAVDYRDDDARAPGRQGRAPLHRYVGGIRSGGSYPPTRAAPPTDARRWPPGHAR